MTADDWEQCDDPLRLLNALGEACDDRRLRLFGAACCRLVWDRLTDARSRAAVEIVEQFADGQATEAHLSAASLKAMQPAGHGVGKNADAWASYWLLARRPAKVIESILDGTIESRQRSAYADALAAGIVDPDELARAYTEARTAAMRDQAAALRDVFCNPFRPVTIDPAWLTWANGTVPALARAIAAERRFGDLPIVADALEEAGCDDPELLAHLRSERRHFHGCWALSLALQSA